MGNLRMHKSCFITFEGIEGAGKSTIIQTIFTYLVAQKFDVIKTREPGGTEVAEAIRRMLLAYYEERIAEDTELLLMFAARAQHIDCVIKPALQKQQIILCDRFTDASFAYQGGGRGINCTRITELENWVQGDLQPDFTILLDLPVEVGLERAQTRDNNLDRIGAEEVEFFQRVRDAYLLRAQNSPERFFIFNVNCSLVEVENKIMDFFINKICPKILN